jgi:hypothetical protein
MFSIKCLSGVHNLVYAAGMNAIDPKTYIKRLTMAERRVLALGMQSKVGYLNNIATAEEPIQLSALYAARLERLSNGEVPRQLSRPDDWMEIWPELAAVLSTRAANDPVMDDSKQGG